MEVFSFIFLPEPSLCLGREFKSLCAFHVAYGNIDEVVNVLAIDCYSKASIPGRIESLSRKFISMVPTDYNLNAATIMTWCSRLLAKGPHDHVPAFPLVDAINNRYGYKTNASDMFYLPSQNGNWFLFKEDVRSRMRG